MHVYNMYAYYRSYFAIITSVCVLLGLGMGFLKSETH